MSYNLINPEFLVSSMPDFGVEMTAEEEASFDAHLEAQEAEFDDSPMWA